MKENHFKKGNKLGLKHGLSKTRLYKMFQNMKSRCYNPNAERYDRYGGRGITICDEWLNDFKSFYNWANMNGYNKKLSIERIDVNGNYEPSNCCFIKLGNQSSNTTRNIKITHNGKTQLLKEWCNELGLKPNTIISRVKLKKISYHDAIFEFKPYQKNDKTHCKNGHLYTDKNSKINNKGYRICLTCKENNKAKYNEKRRLKRHEKSNTNVNKK